METLFLSFVLLFSLFICSTLSQTGSWTNLNPSNTPPGRYLHSAIYDSSLNTMLIFGGQDAPGYVLNDLWSYNISSNNWTQLNPSNPPPNSPPARSGHSAIYVSSLNTMLI